MFKLKSTGEKCFSIPSMKTDGIQSWSANHRRVCILRSTGNVIQIVSKSKLIDL